MDCKGGEGRCAKSCAGNRPIAAVYGVVCSGQWRDCGKSNSVQLS